MSLEISDSSEYSVPSTKIEMYKYIDRKLKYFYFLDADGCLDSTAQNTMLELITKMCKVIQDEKLRTGLNVKDYAELAQKEYSTSLLTKLFDMKYHAPPNANAWVSAIHQYVMDFISPSESSFGSFFEGVMDFYIDMRGFEYFIQNIFPMYEELVCKI